MANKKKHRSGKNTFKRERKRKNIVKLTSGILIVVVLAYFAFSQFFNNGGSTTQERAMANYSAFEFTKQGELTFISPEEEFKAKVDIEIAEDDESRSQGMMYRNKLPETQGMFFIFNYEQLQSFWMRNTVLSLDILFVNKKNEIVTIHKNAKPFDESTYTSNAPAIYVVEVIGGFSNKYNINVGDKIVWRRL